MRSGRRTKHTFRLPPALSRQLADYARSKRVSQASVVEAALLSLLSPDGSERLEAAFSRRLDRISRQLDRLDYHIEVGNEAMGLFVKSWLLHIGPSSVEPSAAAKAAAERRFEQFIEALARLVEGDHRLSTIVPKDE